MGQGVSSAASKTLAVVWILFSLTFLFVLLRLYIRIKITPNSRWGKDDYYYFASFVFFFLYIISIHVSAKFGLGRDISEINPPSDAARGILSELIGQTFLISGNISSKLSVGYFLLRLDFETKRRKCILAPIIAFSVAVTIATLISWFMCRPVAYLWDRSLDGRCNISPVPTAVIAGVLSVLVDLWYAVFPWHMLERNLLPERQRIIISICLSLGVVAAIFGIKRATELNRLMAENYLKNTAKLIMWHSAELAVTLVSTGIPTCLPLYKKRLGCLIDKCSINLWGRRKQLDDEMGIIGMYPVGRTPHNANKQAISPCIDDSTDIQLKDNRVTVQAHRPGSSSNKRTQKSSQQAT
ncbi:hypothetical protein F4825DRAFT_466547 [Nemania diffusa]|nr:hypothetical protein F4825DRAFT_466547 [Nemania diffusa]